MTAFIPSFLSSVFLMPLAQETHLTYPAAVYDHHQVSIAQGAALLQPGGGTLSVGEGLVIDLGKNVGGFVEVGVSHAAANAVLAVAASESLQNLSVEGDKTLATTPLDLLPSNRVVSFSLAGLGTYSSALLQAQYAPLARQNVGLLGAQRYLRVYPRTPGAQISLDFVRISAGPATLNGPTVAPAAGTFLCSDARLNAIWKASVETLLLNIPQNAPVLFDGAKRDRLVFSADLALAAPALTTVLNRPDVLRASLQLLARGQQSDGYLPAVAASPTEPNGGFINTESAGFPSVPAVLGSRRFAEYVGWWIHGLSMYYLHTGDTATVATLWPQLEKAVGYLQSQTDSSGVFVARPPSAAFPGNEATWHPRDTPLGKVVATNAVFYQAFGDAAALANALGKNPQRARWTNAAKQLKKAVQKDPILFNPTVGAFRISEQASAHHAQDGNALAALFDLATPQQANSALAYLSQLQTPFGPATVDGLTPAMSYFVSPFMSHYEVQARFRYNSDDEALGILRTTWGNMLDQGPGNTFWEAVDPQTGSPTPYLPVFTVPFAEQNLSVLLSPSQSHAWSAGPAASLLSEVVGIAPTAPGFAQYQVVPHPGDLNFAQGSVATPHGNIEVRWSRSLETGFTLSVTAPIGTVGKVGLPKGPRGEVMLDGVILKPKQQDATRVYLSGLPSGKHTLTSR